MTDDLDRAVQAMREVVDGLRDIQDDYYDRFLSLVWSDSDIEFLKEAEIKP